MEEELGGDKPVRARALLVASRPDEASMNIARALMASYGFEPTGLEFEGSPIYSSGDVALIFIDVETIHAEHVDKALEGLEAVIFVSKHSSRAGIACLSTHTPGNLGPEADYGGKPMELAWSDPNRLRVALRALVEAREELGLSEYMPCLEATHHGPTGLGLPVLFVEIGSTPDRWADEVAAEAVARAAWEAARASPGHGIKKAVGFGGGHYAPKFSKLVLE
ncbi:D-tyrosyl-tRNA(Tyr) deacylase, partial [Candidatus Bathyarchaeota archaeon]